MLKILWLVFAMIIALVASPLVAQEAAGSLYLESIASPRVTALGQAFTGVADDVSALFANPAGMATQGSTALEVYGYSAFESQYLGVGAVIPLDRWSFGIGMLGVQSPNGEATVFDGSKFVRTGASFAYSGFAVYFGAAMEVNSVLSVGLTTKYVMESLSDQSANGVAVDVGLMGNLSEFIPISEETLVGFSAQNIVTTEMAWDAPLTAKTKLPVIVSVGASLRYLDRQLLVTVALRQKQGRDLTVHGGLEYLLDQVALRGGYSDQQWSVGTGLCMTEFCFDFAYILPREGEDDFLDPESRFSLTIKL